MHTGAGADFVCGDLCRLEFDADPADSASLPAANSTCGPEAALRRQARQLATFTRPLLRALRAVPGSAVGGADFITVGDGNDFVSAGAGDDTVRGTLALLVV